MRPSAELLKIRPDVSDRRIAMMIAEALLELDRQPYCFTINHDVRPPKSVPCRVHYDWARKDRVGITTLDRERARRWLIRAALAGYTISQAQSKGREKHHPTGRSLSLTIARNRAEYERNLSKLDFNDDIPF